MRKSTKNPISTKGILLFLLEIALGIIAITSLYIWIIGYNTYISGYTGQGYLTTDTVKVIAYAAIDYHPGQIFPQDYRSLKNQGKKPKNEYYIHPQRSRRYTRIPH